MSADDTPPRLWWSASVHATSGWGLIYRKVDGEFVEPLTLPDDAVELHAVPAGRDDMCLQMGCGLDRGSVVNELSRLLRGMARRVGQFRETASILADPEMMDDLRQGQQEDAGTGVDLRGLSTGHREARCGECWQKVPLRSDDLLMAHRHPDRSPCAGGRTADYSEVQSISAVPAVAAPDVTPAGQCEHEVQAHGLRLTVAAQARQLGVLETVRLSTDALIAELRGKVAAAPGTAVGMADLSALLHSAAQAADELSYLSCAESLRDVARTVEQRPDLARAVAAALSGEAETDAR
jgi:hypothetical protein